ncbi:hypothetical protein SUGI_0495820, partial [Cryptomeria japonica]
WKGESTRLIIVRYRNNARQMVYGTLASSSPGDSGRFSWDSAYIRLPGDSNEISFVTTSTSRPLLPPASVTQLKEMQGTKHSG